MKTKAKYEIELAASKDECRQVITNVQLDKKNNCLIATDGKILAIVPVETDIDDISGPVSPEAFKNARKGVSKKQREDNAEINIACKQKELKVYGKNDVTTMQRPNMNLNYPNYKQIIPRNEATIKIIFNPEYLLRIAKAIGSSESVTLEIVDELSPITVYPNQKGNDAFGILMPLREIEGKDAIDHSSIKAKYLK